jgi:hypothetical protein
MSFYLMGQTNQEQQYNRQSVLHAWKREEMDMIQKPAENRPLGRHRHRWKGIDMDIKDIQLKDMDWIHLVQKRQMVGVVNTVICVCSTKKETVLTS